MWDFALCISTLALEIRYAVLFFIHGPDRSLRVDGFRTEVEPSVISLHYDEKLIFDDCSLLLHQRTRAQASGVPAVVSESLPRSTWYLLDEAIQGLTFIRDTADLQTRDDVLPPVVANLNGLLPRVGNKRFASGSREDEAPSRRYGGGAHRTY